jgi:hypothetical protein
MKPTPDAVLQIQQWCICRLQMPDHIHVRPHYGRGHHHCTCDIGVLERVWQYLCMLPYPYSNVVNAA